MGKLTLKDIPIEKPIIVLLGPTASGKTDLSLVVHEQIDCEIISADSRQVYKYLDIGTAKPSKEILKKYTHHLIDFLDPDENFSAGEFVKLSNNIIEKIYEQNKIPLLVGGTGLYIDLLCNGLIQLPSDTQNLEIRDKLNEELKHKGKEYLFHLLKSVDPESATKYADMNPRRTIRALEFYFETGIKFSEAQNELTRNSLYKPYYIGINFEREALYNRINQRCDWMWNNGIVQETEKVLQMGYSSYLNSLNTVGYKEVIKFLQKEFTEEKALEEMKKNTRRYAKRQLTWFRRNEKINWIQPQLIDKFIIYDFLINQK